MQWNACEENLFSNRWDVIRTHISKVSSAWDVFKSFIGIFYDMFVALQKKSVPPRGFCGTSDTVNCVADGEAIAATTAKQSQCTGHEFRRKSATVNCTDPWMKMAMWRTY